MKLSVKFNKEEHQPCVQKYNRNGNEKSPVLPQIARDLRTALPIGVS